MTKTELLIFCFVFLFVFVFCLLLVFKILFPALTSVVSTIFIMVNNSGIYGIPCNQTNADVANIFIPEYTCLLRQASQQPREVKVVHVEDPIYIKVTNGNL